MTEYHWTPYCTKKHLIPDGALIAGKDKDQSEIYIGRTICHGDQLPCKIVPHRHEAYVSHDGKEIKVEDCEILIEKSTGHHLGRRLKWISQEGGDVPSHAVEGGKTANGETLYIGRTKERVGLHHVDSIGKVHPSHGVLYVPFGGKEVAHKSYEILVHHL